MSENEMGYRGSKSEFLNPQPIEISVKEQRVDGSWFIKKNGGCSGAKQINKLKVYSNGWRKLLSIQNPF
jgi:hypothetical protein